MASAHKDTRLAVHESVHTPTVVWRLRTGIKFAHTATQVLHITGVIDVRVFGSAVRIACTLLMLLLRRCYSKLGITLRDCIIVREHLLFRLRSHQA